MLGSKVTFPPVTVKLHWPSTGCPACAGETRKVSHEIYQCVSCGLVNTGHNKYIEGKVRVL